MAISKLKGIHKGIMGAILALGISTTPFRAYAYEEIPAQNKCLIRDVNNDGKLDYVTIKMAPDFAGYLFQVRLGENDCSSLESKVTKFPARALEKQPEITWAGETYYEEFDDWDVLDMDKDGIKDLVCITYEPMQNKNYSYIMKGKGDGTFNDPVRKEIGSG